MNLEGSTYDEIIRKCIRVIAFCELEKARLRAQLVMLAIEEAIASVTNPEKAQEIAELRQAIEEEIKALDEMEHSARRLMYQLRRDHGPVKDARQSAPEYGAERHYHAGVPQ